MAEQNNQEKIGNNELKPSGYLGSSVVNWITLIIQIRIKVTVANNIQNWMTSRFR